MPDCLLRGPRVCPSTNPVSEAMPYNFELSTHGLSCSCECARAVGEAADLDNLVVVDGKDLKDEFAGRLPRSLGLSVSTLARAPSAKRCRYQSSTSPRSVCTLRSSGPGDAGATPTARCRGRCRQLRDAERCRPSRRCRSLRAPTWWGRTAQLGSPPRVGRGPTAAHWRSRRSWASRTRRRSREAA
jgi:hypothetical protein